MMMRKWKRMWAAALALILSFVMVAGVPASAAESLGNGWYTDGKFVWDYWYNGEIRLYSADARSGNGSPTYNYGDTLVIPGTLEGHNVDWIGAYGFADHTEIKRVVIEYGATRILKGAFAGLKELTEITIPTSVEEIQEYTFDECGFTELYIPPSVTKLRYLGEMPNIKNLYYSKACDPNDLSAVMTDDANEIMYEINSDNTVSLTMRESSFVDYGKKIPFSVPEYLDGREVVSFTVLEEVPFKPQITCDRHKPDQWHYDENKHWFTKCSVCGNEVKGEAHTYETSNPNNACDCGYIPYTYTPSTAKQDATLEYGSVAGRTLSVDVKPTLGNENITYQWYENDTAITGANQSTYLIPADKKVGTYTYYCKMNCGGYEVTGEASTITVVKKKITVQADSKKKYAGEANPALTYTVPTGVLAAGDTTADWQAALTTTATQSSPAGTYPITGTITASQYDITVTPATLTVEKKTDDKTLTDQSGGDGSDTETYVNPEKATPKKNDYFKKGNAVYKVTKTGKNATVTFIRPIKKKKTLTIPATVKAGGVTYQVTAIAKNACKKNTKLTTLTIGKNVKSIGDKAFYGCKNLKKITVKTTKLKKNKVGRQVFKGISKKAVVKLPKKKLGPYKVMFQAAVSQKSLHYATLK